MCSRVIMGVLNLNENELNPNLSAKEVEDIHAFINQFRPLLLQLKGR